MVSAQSVITHFLENNILLRDQSKQLNLENTVRVSIGNEQQMAKVLELFEQINKAQSK